MANWTKAQQAAIDIQNKTILVSAAAGSGKTAVLVERIIREITREKDPLDVDALLVMTFTRAAAAQMKERIYHRLEALWQGEEHPEKKERLKKQMLLLEGAKIMTIDSFCLSVVRENIDKLPIDPMFSLAEENDLVLLQGDVLEEILEQEYENSSPEFSLLADAFAGSRGDKRIGEFILGLYKVAASQPWPKKWLQGLVEVPDAWQEYMKEQLGLMLGEGVKKMDLALEIAAEPGGPAVYLPEFQLERLQLERAGTAEDMLSMAAALKTITFDRLKAARKVDEDLKTRAKNLRDGVKKLVVEKLVPAFFFEEERLKEETAFSAAITRALVDITLKFMEALEEKKAEKNIMDFSDMEHLALGILTNPDGTPSQRAEIYREQFAEIYIDEYQDSNRLQEELVRAIEKNNVFMVGDVKQSIYGFRQASPELFNEKYREYPDYFVLEGPKNKVLLNQNFRSRKEVLQSINGIFLHIMQEGIGGIAYGPQTALYPGASFAESPDCKSEILLITGKEKGGSEARLEARVIAKRIRRLFAEKFLVTEGENRRPLEYGDIVILLRSGSDYAAEMDKVLKDEGIPAYSGSSKGYFATLEVKKILAVLGAIDNPYQDIPLAAFLNSAIIGMEDRELSYIAALYKKEKDPEFFRLYQALLYGRDHEKLEEGVRQKIRTALQILKTYRERAKYLSIEELLLSFYNETNYLELAGALPGGSARKANLLLLVQKAKSYEKTGYRGLFHFIRYIQRLKDFNTDFGEAVSLSEGENQVQIMTIHRSKGLEFPICFVAGTQRRFNEMDLRTGVVVDQSLGLGWDYVDMKHNIKESTLKKNALKLKKKNDMLGEELRILYVALTRAKEKLIITGCVKDEEKADQKMEHREVSLLDIRGAACFLDWILMSFSSEDFHLEKISLEDAVDQEEKKQIRAEELKKHILRQEPLLSPVIKERLGFSYPHQGETRRDTKLSISELKRFTQPAPDPKSRVLFEGRKRSGDLEGALSRGNAYHRLLQFLDYEGIDPANIRESLLAQLPSMGFSKGNLFEKKPRELAAIEGFLTSELGERFFKAQKEGRLFREQPFMMGISAQELGLGDSQELVLIQGMIDAYIEGEDILLADYKTDWVREEQELVERYRYQMLYYKRALEMMTGKQVRESYLYSFALGRAIPL